MPPSFPAVASLLAQEEAPGSPLGGLLTVVVLLVPVYVAFMFLPKFAGPKRSAVKALKKHDRIATSGGLIGTVAVAPAEGDREVAVKFGEARVSVLRDHVTAVLTPPADAPQTRPADPKA